MKDRYKRLIAEKIVLFGCLILATEANLAVGSDSFGLGSLSNTELSKRQELGIRAQTEVDAYFKCNKSEKLMAIINQWRTEEIPIDILFILLKNAVSNEKLALDNVTSSISCHDITIKRERCIWALEQLLDCSFKLSCEEEKRMAIRTARYYTNYYIAREYLKQLGIIPEDMSLTERIKLASSMQTSETIIYVLSNDRNIDIRKAIAIHPKAPYDVLDIYDMENPSLRELTKIGRMYARLSISLEPCPGVYCFDKKKYQRDFTPKEK